VQWVLWIVVGTPAGFDNQKLGARQQAVSDSHD